MIRRRGREREGMLRLMRRMRREQSVLIGYDMFRSMPSMYMMDRRGRVLVMVLVVMMMLLYRRPCIIYMQKVQNEISS